MLDAKELSIEKIEDYKLKLAQAINSKRKASILSNRSNFLIQFPILMPCHNTIQKKLLEVNEYLKAKYSNKLPCYSFSL
jgi:hypothetical protein